MFHFFKFLALSFITFIIFITQGIFASGPTIIHKLDNETSDSLSTKEHQEKKSVTLDLKNLHSIGNVEIEKSSKSNISEKPKRNFLYLRKQNSAIQDPFENQKVEDTLETLQEEDTLETLQNKEEEEEEEAPSIGIEKEDPLLSKHTFVDIENQKFYSEFLKLKKIFKNDLLIKIIVNNGTLDFSTNLQLDITLKPNSAKSEDNFKQFQDYIKELSKIFNENKNNIDTHNKFIIHFIEWMKIYKKSDLSNLIIAFNERFSIQEFFVSETLEEVTENLKKYFNVKERTIERDILKKVSIDNNNHPTDFITITFNHNPDSIQIILNIDYEKLHNTKHPSIQDRLKSKNKIKKAYSILEIHKDTRTIKQVVFYPYDFLIFNFLGEKSSTALGFLYDVARSSNDEEKVRLIEKKIEGYQNYHAKFYNLNKSILSLVSRNNPIFSQLNYQDPLNHLDFDFDPYNHNRDIEIYYFCESEKISLLHCKPTNIRQKENQIYNKFYKTIKVNGTEYDVELNDALTTHETIQMSTEDQNISPNPLKVIVSTTHYTYK